MQGLMMDFPLTLTHLFDRAGTYFANVEIISRRSDQSVHRTTYGEVHARVQRLANALQRLGLKPGDRVATLGWNSSRHLEAYFAIPLAGGVLHTLNPRLSGTDLAYIMNHAEDQILLLDEVLLPVFEKFKKDVSVRHVIVWPSADKAPLLTTDYEELIAAEEPHFTPPPIEENQAAGVCYTSGTTGHPKGVVFSHRSTVLHSLAAALPDVLGLSRRDVVLPVVPMFHANAWGLPYTATMLGIKLVFPGPHLDAKNVLDLISQEKVTFAAGVPTVWLAILEALDKDKSRWDVSQLKTMLIGGSAAPQAMIEAFEKRHGLNVLHAWGMTEMSPLGTVCRLKPQLDQLPEAERFRLRATQGLPSPLVELRVVGDTGLVANDGKSMGELQARGPWIAKSYFKNPGEADKFTKDGWLRTGDIVTVDHEGYVRITDRSKDLIKSGGEWISSVDLENALMGHPAVKEAAVIALPHPKWDERPVACVVLKEGAKATGEELRKFLEPSFAKFWLPDAFVFLGAIPRTAVGKFLKSALREQIKSVEWREG